jgi:hypothetical protein
MLPETVSVSGASKLPPVIKRLVTVIVEPPKKVPAACLKLVSVRVLLMVIVVFAPV